MVVDPTTRGMVVMVLVVEEEEDEDDLASSDCSSSSWRGRKRGANSLASLIAKMG